MTTADFDSCYRAVSARDRRFDGQFFVAVHTTGIYCRPSCPATTPKPANVTFLPTAAAAQQRGYRACRRCLPDEVPGSPRWNLNDDLAARAMRLIGDGVVERDGVTGLAGALGYSTRQLNRVLTDELGAGALALARARRATDARVMIQRTSMSMSDIAFAAGFNSVRQFNDTIKDVFGLTPSALRSCRTVNTDAERGCISLNLPLRQPYSINWMNTFLAGHVTSGIESHDGHTYRRVLGLPHGAAIAAVVLTPTHARVTLTNLNMRDVGVATARIRRLLDADADAHAIDAALGSDMCLEGLVSGNPGIRLPGSVDGWEVLVRTMIGQQVSIAAARTHISALVRALGEPLPANDSPITHRFPAPEAVAEHGNGVLRGPRARTTAIVNAAHAVAENTVALHPGMPATELRTSLLGLRGIGEWTAAYVSMRILNEPDVLLSTDLAIIRAADELGIDLSSRQPSWSPWRSYATMHLWRHYLTSPRPTSRSSDHHNNCPPKDSTKKSIPPQSTPGR